MATIIKYRDKAWLAENLLALPAVAVVAGVIAYWALVTDRQPPILLTNGIVHPNVVHPGDVIYPTWKLEKIRGGAWSAVLSREIVDGRGKVSRDDTQIIHEVVYPNETSISTDVPVPYDAQFGKSKYRLIGCYRSQGFSLTRWFPVCIQWPELRFDIIPK